MGKKTGRSVSDVTRTPRRERLKFHKYSKGPVLPSTHARVVEEKSVETRMGVRPMQREQLPDLVTVGSSFELRVIRSPEQDAPHAASRVFLLFLSRTV